MSSTYNKKKDGKFTLCANTQVSELMIVKKNLSLFECIDGLQHKTKF